ncbi:hypothetical protein BH11BAC1_BH11BAC1_11860 [soil metagenome]
MTFKEWRAWYKELPWTTKWFVILILFRPIIDNFYKLKEISPLISPLYIVGVLTPVLVIISISSKKSSIRSKSGIINLFFVFGFLVIVNWILIIIFVPRIETIGYTIKAFTPTILFLYLLYTIRTERDLHGILVTFLYSGLYLMLMMLYEMIFGSISGAHVSEGRGGGERLIGVYNDMMNYAIYIVGALLIGGYFFLKNIYSRNKSKHYVLNFSVILVCCLLGLIGIKHVSTWVVCLVIFILLSFYNLKNFKGFFIMLFFVSVIFLLFGDEIYNGQVEPLINKEINVASGETEIEGGLNGRIGRWERYFDVWFTEIPVISRFIGVPTSGHKLAFVMCGAGMHNDFIRSLFTAGIIGILAYLTFLVMIIYRARYFRVPERFLILGAIAAIILHSISTLPLAYSAYSYLLFTIFAFSLLPLKQAYKAYVATENPKNKQQRSRVSRVTNSRLLTPQK